jgi:hypothetical protein
MDDNFQNTDYFKYLIENVFVMETELSNFNDKILPLLQSKTDEMGLVLKCHLILEYYIDEYLIAAHPTISNFFNARLTFNQKIDLINNTRTVFGMFNPSIKALNTLRNKFSHRLSYEVQNDDLREIVNTMTIWNTAAGKKTPAGTSLILDFTMMMCGFLDSMTKNIKRLTPQLGLGGYLEWLSSMTKKK